MISLSVKRNPVRAFIVRKWKTGVGFKVAGRAGNEEEVELPWTREVLAYNYSLKTIKILPVQRGLWSFGCHTKLMLLSGIFSRRV